MEKFVSRIQAVPSDELFDNQLPPEVEEMQTRQLEAALVVDKLKKHMTQEESVICSGIMEGLSYDEIAQKLGRSKGWVSNRLKAFKQRILEKADTGTL